jgi:hypothetical protein
MRLAMLTGSVTCLIMFVLARRLPASAATTRAKNDALIRKAIA